MVFFSTEQRLGDQGDPVLLALRQALAQAHHRWAEVALERLRDKGLAHDHVRLVGTGALARIPKQSQMALGAADNLAYQLACFGRAMPSQHTPTLLGHLPPSEALPRGALLVQEIVGRAAALPRDLPAIAHAFAALHALPVSPPSSRAPLLDAPDGLLALVQEISAQAQFAALAQLPPLVAKTLQCELQSLQDLCAQSPRPVRHLIVFDGHPGNFIIQMNDRAVLVDLEKCRYGYPGLDLAHASLYTSTTWDVDTHAVLSAAQVLDFYRAWEQAVGAAAQAARPWHLPLRRAMWLWSLSWCAKWRVLSAQTRKAGGDGEDWSSERSDASLVAHVRDRVDLYLSEAGVSHVLQEFVVLEQAWADMGGQ